MHLIRGAFEDKVHVADLHRPQEEVLRGAESPDGAIAPADVVEEARIVAATHQIDLARAAEGACIDA